MPRELNRYCPIDEDKLNSFGIREEQQGLHVTWYIPNDGSKIGISPLTEEGRKFVGDFCKPKRGFTVVLSGQGITLKNFATPSQKLAELTEVPCSDNLSRLMNNLREGRFTHAYFERANGEGANYTKVLVFSSRPPSDLYHTGRAANIGSVPIESRN